MDSNGLEDTLSSFLFTLRVALLLGRKASVL
mgnify:CR=1 FL=1